MKKRKAHNFQILFQLQFNFNLNFPMKIIVTMAREK